MTAIISKASDSGKKEIIGQPWDVYIGSTHVSNPEDFLKQVQLLTGKFQFFVFFVVLILVLKPGSLICWEIHLDNVNLQTNLIRLIPLLELEVSEDDGIDNPAFEATIALEISCENSTEILVKE